MRPLIIDGVRSRRLPGFQFLPLVCLLETVEEGVLRGRIAGIHTDFFSDDTPQTKAVITDELGSLFDGIGLADPDELTEDAKRLKGQLLKALIGG